jgi:hypothetical protein
MITYEVEYTVGQEPQLCKKIEIADGSKVSTNLTTSNKDELENFTNEQIMEHVNNYLLYIQELSKDMYIFPEEELYFHHIPVNNYIEVEQTMTNIVHWLEYGLFRNKESHVASHSHTHDEPAEETPA